jgi:hypothetical protein
VVRFAAALETTKPLRTKKTETANGPLKRIPSGVSAQMPGLSVWSGISCGKKADMKWKMTTTSAASPRSPSICASRPSLPLKFDASYRCRENQRIDIPGQR